MRIASGSKSKSPTQPLLLQQSTSSKDFSGCQHQNGRKTASFVRFDVPFLHVFCLSGNPRMDKWIPGSIAARMGDLHYAIVYEGKQLKRHVDQIRRFHDSYGGYNENKTHIEPSNEAEARSNQTGYAPRRMHFYGGIVTSQQKSTLDEETSSTSRASTVDSSDGYETPGDGSPVESRFTTGFAPFRTTTPSPSSIFAVVVE